MSFALFPCGFCLLAGRFGRNSGTDRADLARARPGKGKAMSVTFRSLGERTDVLGDCPCHSGGAGNHDMLDKSDVASLTANAINRMSRDELVRVIRVSKLPAMLCPAMDQNLPFHDQAVLTRLAFLARQCCRNQLGEGGFDRQAELGVTGEIDNPVNLPGQVHSRNN
jgi:hypothetical protein